MHAWETEWLLNLSNRKYDQWMIEVLKYAIFYLIKGLQ